MADWRISAVLENVPHSFYQGGQFNLKVWPKAFSHMTSHHVKIRNKKNMYWHIQYWVQFWTKSEKLLHFIVQILLPSVAYLVQHLYPCYTLELDIGFWCEEIVFQLKNCIRARNWETNLVTFPVWIWGMSGHDFAKEVLVARATVLLHVSCIYGLIGHSVEPCVLVSCWKIWILEAVVEHVIEYYF